MQSMKKLISGLVAALAFSTSFNASSALRAVEQDGTLRRIEIVEFDHAVPLHFAVTVDRASLNERTVTIVGPQGVVRGAVSETVEGFVFRPLQQLQPGATYSVFVDGAQAAGGKTLPFTSTSFEVAPKLVRSAEPRQGQAAGAIDGGEWIPGPENFGGKWRTFQPHVAVDAKLAPKAATGITGLSGRVLQLDGSPLEGVSLSVGAAAGKSDSEGYFLLEGVAAGSNTLIIDGAPASSTQDSYGYYEALVDVAKSKTTVLPYVIWMSKLDRTSTVRFSSPTREEVVITSQRMPGLEIRIPKGSVLRDRQGKIVNEVTLTPLPVDRPPFPMPPSEFPVYFTLQPGGVTITPAEAGRVTPAEVIYPNYTGMKPGARTNAWLYDPFEKGWHIYGEGSVDAAGTKIAMDAGVGFYQFTGGAHTSGPSGGPPVPCDTCPKGAPGGGSGGGKGGGSSGGTSTVGSSGSGMGGDPVSLATGILIQEEWDVTVPDLLPLEVNRVYRHTNPNLSTFGYGWTSALDMYLYFPTNMPYVMAVMPNGMQIEFEAITGGFNGAVYKHTKSSGEFYGALLQSTPQLYWRMTLRDGREFHFDTHNYSSLIAYGDRHGNFVRIGRNTSGKVSRVTGPSGRWLDFSLNGNGTVSQIKDQAGRTWSYAYQSSYLQSVTDPGGGVRAFTYDGSNRLHTVTDAANNLVVEHDYDANNRVSMQTFANSETMQFAYTVVNSKVVQTDVTDQRGKVRRVLFDSDGQVVGSTYPFNEAEEQITTFTRSARGGQVVSMTDPMSRTTQYGFDGYGNLNSVTRMYGTSQAATTTFTYEPYYHQLATVTDPLNHTWTWGFDAARNPITLTDPLSHVKTFAYNTQGQVTSVTDALSHAWTYSYSGADLATVTDPLNQVTQYFSNSIGQVTHTVNPAGETSKNEYDTAGRLKKTYDGLGQVVEFVYNTAGQMASHKDQKANTTSYTYNSLGLVDTKTDALLNSESYAYGANGMLSRITDRKGQVTGIAYDFLNRVSQVGFGATTANPTTYTSTIGYTLDDGDRATTITDSANGNIGRTYDDFDRLTQEVTAEGTVNYTYDSAGRRATMMVAGQTQVVYTWDNANRLTHITQGTDVVQFAYDNANRRTSTTLPNGVVQAYDYDNANQLTSITYTKGAATIGDLGYTYDLAGRRVKVSGTMAATLLPAAVPYATYNVNNQLTSWAGTSHTYDLNGNLTYDSAKTFAWNARDQLSGLSGGVTANFAYDGMGRRRSKTIASTQTAFLYDRLNAVQELAGSTVLANLMVGQIDEVFQRRTSSETLVPLQEILGSTLATTNSAGSVQTSWAYQPYGETAISGQSSGLAQGFTGRERDLDGLFYYRSRYYQPTTGRFISEDLLAHQAGPNFYNYVSSAPTEYRDPLGLAKWTGTGKSMDYGPYGRDEYDLTSECKGGTQIRVKIEVTYFGFGRGFGSTGGDADFDDGFACANPMAFAGPAFKVSGGAAAGYGVGFNFTILGRATSPGGWSVQEGLGLSAGPAIGASSVKSYSVRGCQG